MIKITTNSEEKNIVFANLKAGDIFKYRDSFYIKIENSDYDAINLVSGRAAVINNYDSVLLAKSAELNLEF